MRSSLLLARSSFQQARHQARLLLLKSSTVVLVETLEMFADLEPLLLAVTEAVADHMGSGHILCPPLELLAEP
jgi:hypothetical protein